MPPKKAAGGASKKTVEKAKQRIVEDKTFGLKNKKGAKAQKFIAQVEQQVQHKFGGKTSAAQQKRNQEANEERQLMNDLFKPVLPKPKKVEAKGEAAAPAAMEAIKKDIYTDYRDLKKEGTMEGWDQEQLEKVVKEKHGNQAVNQTEIICKHFLDAVERNLYGWFWTCPNGGESCKYRHALPAGYVLKRDKKKKDTEEATISLEELIDRERAALGPNVTPITLDSFLKWKKQKIAEKKKRLAAEQKRKRKELNAAGGGSLVTGREFFNFRPELAVDDDADATTDNMKQRFNADDEEADFTVPTGEGAAGEGGEGAAANGAAAKPEMKEFDASIFEKIEGIDDEDIVVPEEDDDDDDAPASSAAAAAAAASASASAGVTVDAGLFADVDANLEDLHDEEDDDEEEEAGDEDGGGGEAGGAAEQEQEDEED